MLKFALAGNPNCGKTTLFNSLTGSTAHVGNWPGVTVDKREGVYKKCAEPISIVDLPGIYSLSPYTPEEVVSRNFILDEKPDCVINIVDATNLERNLYLTSQVMEIDVPVIIALNMMDMVEKNGDQIDAKTLEEKIGLPVVAISALKETGLKELMDRAFEIAKQPRKGATVLEDSKLIHLIGDCKIALEGQGVDNALFHAVKLVELDELEVADHPEQAAMVEEFKKTFEDDVFGNDFEAIVADARYKYIAKNYSPALKKKVKSVKEKLTVSDKIDKVLTNRWVGIPIFLVILFCIFHLTFSEDFLYLGAYGVFDEAVEQAESLPEVEYATDLEEHLAGLDANFFFGYGKAGAIYSPGFILFQVMDAFTSTIIAAVDQGLTNIAAADWVHGFLCDGILSGLAAVMSFLPQILLLFLFFSLLEDSGYMARVAFILDRIFRKFGLSGKSFMPMIMGFGCSIPAMTNTRTLATENERIATIRVIPFFSCSAKLPILTAVAGGIVQMFGVSNVDLITFGMYVLGMAVAIISVILMRTTTMRGEVPPFIMELPAYHVPQFKALMIHLWDKLKHFVKKAFTIIFASTILIWLISHISWDWRFLADEQINESILAGLGMVLQPIFTPLGFGSQLGQYGWVFVVAAITGLIAKENVIATFGTLAACLEALVGTTLLPGGEAIAEGSNEVLAMIAATNGNIAIPGLIAFIVFNMTTIPCFAAVATAKAELPNKKSYHGTLLFWLGTSYILSMMVYLIGTWPWTTAIFIVVWAAIFAVIALDYTGKINVKKFFANIKAKLSRK